MGITEEQLRALNGRVKSKASGVYCAIGIDPGVNTGVAIMMDGRLIEVKSCTAVEAEVRICTLYSMMRGLDKTFHVYVEDTRKLRLPKALQSKGRERGAGSVGRDMGRWSEFLTYHSIPHTMCGLVPKEYRVMTDEQFRKKTGWDKRTNEHSRCAAGLILGR